jgi:serine/threonine-protein kinase RsbW
MTTVPESGGHTPVPGHDGDDVVALTVPAAAGYLGVVRTATAGLAARLQFTLDEIEDLRIAVDEACTMLLRNAAAQADLTCRFMLTEEAVLVTISVAAEAQPTRPHSLSWQVLTSLASDVSLSQEDGRTSLQFRKKRAA